MGKIWYVFKNERHIGPFSFDDIKAKVEAGDFSRATLVWKEGEKSWISLFDSSVFKTLFIPAVPVTEPDLPEIPQDEVIKIQEEEQQEIIIEEESDCPPPFQPEVNISSPIEVEVPVETIDVVEEESPPPFEPLVPEVEEEEVEEVVQKICELPELDDIEEIEETEEVEEVDSIPEPKLEDVLELGPELLVSEELEHEDIPLEVVSKKGKLPKFFLFLISLSIIAGWSYFYLSSESMELQKQLLFTSDLNRLEKTRASKSVKPKFALALSKNGKQFVLSSNIISPYNVYLELKSLNAEVIGSEKVMMTSISNMNNGVAVFDTIKLELGSKMIRGMYSYRVQGIDTSLKVKFFKFLKKLEVFSFLPFVNDVDDRSNFRGDFLLGYRTKAEFKKSLETYKKNEKVKKTLPLRELLESYRTYGAILREVSAIFKTSLVNFSKRGATNTFASKYARYIAPLYQTIAIQNQKTKVRLIESENELADEFKKLVEFGKEVGVLVSDMNEKLNSYKKIKKKKRLELLKEFSARLSQLEELCKMRVYKLKQALSDI